MSDSLKFPIIREANITKVDPHKPGASQVDPLALNVEHEAFIEGLPKGLEKQSVVAGSPLGTGVVGGWIALQSAETLPSRAKGALNEAFFRVRKRLDNSPDVRLLFGARVARTIPDAYVAEKVSVTYPDALRGVGDFNFNPPRKVDVTTAQITRVPPSQPEAGPVAGRRDPLVISLEPRTPVVLGADGRCVVRAPAGSELQVLVAHRNGVLVSKRQYSVPESGQILLQEKLVADRTMTIEGHPDFPKFTFNT